MSKSQLIEYAPMLELIEKKKNQYAVRVYRLKDTQDPNGSPFDSLIKVGIVKYNTRALSAQFQ